MDIISLGEEGIIRAASPFLNVPFDHVERINEATLSKKYIK